MSDWQAIAAKFKSDLDAKIPSEWKLPQSLFPLPTDVSNLIPTCGLLTPLQLEILAQDATGLRDAIASRKYTSVQVAESFCRAAVIMHQATNCLMDFFPEEAMERAKWLDEQLERTGQVVGPLHGVPISIKDQVAVAGRPFTLGYVSSIGVHEHDSTMAALLREAGAVFYAKTTLPQAIMHLETSSFLGVTVNPHNTNLTAGGSSGGEGAMIGGHASVLGIGTDIGGSIRGPAAVCGIFGFKPTVGRIPAGGCPGLMVGQQSILSTAGPMAASARDLGLFMKVMSDGQPWLSDHTAHRIPWRPEDLVMIGQGQPRIGIMWDDGIVKPLPPMRRAMEMTVKKLKEAGLEVVDVQPFKTVENWDIASRCYFTDGGERVRKAAEISGEPLRPLTKWAIERTPGALSASEVIDLGLRREIHRAEWTAHFNSLYVDVIICPPAPGPAPLLDTSKYWGYTAMFNLLDVPAGVFPTGLKVEPSDVAEKRSNFLSPDDEQIWTAYDPSKQLDAPLSIQVVGRRWEDENVVRAIEIISEIVRKPLGPRV